MGALIPGRVCSSRERKWKGFLASLANPLPTLRPYRGSGRGAGKGKGGREGCGMCGGSGLSHPRGGVTEVLSIASFFPLHRDERVVGRQALGIVLVP